MNDNTIVILILVTCTTVSLIYGYYMQEKAAMYEKKWKQVSSRYAASIEKAEKIIKSQKKTIEQLKKLVEKEKKRKAQFRL